MILKAYEEIDQAILPDEMENIKIRWIALDLDRSYLWTNEILFSTLKINITSGINKKEKKESKRKNTYKRKILDHLF